MMMMMMLTTVIWVLLLGVANLSSGYNIPQPAGYTASFSKSSASSASASASHSFTVNGNVTPEQLEQLKNSIQNEAVAAAHAEAGSAVAGAGTVAQAGAVAAATTGTFEPSVADVHPAAEIEPYKVIGTDKYTTKYTGNNHATNYAISGTYVEDSQKANTKGGCLTCNGPFPGPSGSIHDYKLVSGSTGIASIPTVPAVVPLPVRPIKINYVSGHVSPNLIATFPGPSGSIYSSKPVSGTTSGGSYHVAGSTGSFGGSYGSTGSSGVVSAPVSTGSYGTGSTISSESSNNYQGTTYTQQPTLQALIPILPGPSGSIYDSKPVATATYTSPVTPTYAESNYNSQSSSSSSSGSQAVFTSAPVVTSAPAVIAGSSVGTTNKFPGSTGSIHSYKPISNIPQVHPQVGPVCAYSPGSGQKCQTGSSDFNAYSGAGSITNNPQESNQPQGTHSVSQSSSGSASSSSFNAINGAGSVTNTPQVKPEKVVAPINVLVPPVFLQPTVYKSEGSDELSAYSGAGSITNNPIHHPVVVAPKCTYRAGSATQCGSNVVVPPSIHPIAPESGTYYINKQTAVDVEAPTVSFSGQIPCSGTSCGSTIVFDDSGEHQFKEVSHDSISKSGNVVYENSDGSYGNGQGVYKNAESGGYAVSSEGGKGSLIGPGTGQLPIEADKPLTNSYGALVAEQSKYSSSASGSVENSETPINTPCVSGICGISKVEEKRPNTDSGFATGQVVLTQGGNTFDITNSQATASSTGQIIDNSDETVNKVPCRTGKCSNGNVYVVEELPHQQSGFASGQVVQHQAGSNNYNSQGVVSNYGGNEQIPCDTDKCSNPEVSIVEERPSKSGNSQFNGGYAGSFGHGGYGGAYASSGLLGKLFGSGGLSGNAGAFSGGYVKSGAYSRSGAYSHGGGSSSSFASAGSYAHGF